jgi:hypothetical protein
MRTLIADAIESLILLLDEIDGDADHEEENEHGGDIIYRPHDGDVDDEPDADDEPRFVRRLRRAEPPAGIRVIGGRRTFALAAVFVWRLAMSIVSCRPCRKSGFPIPFYSHK